MIRKSMLTAVVVVLAVLSLSALCWAQDVWNFNKFTADYERLLYEIVTWEETWDYELDEEVVNEIKYYEQWEFRAQGDGSVEVTMGYRYWVPSDKMQDQMTFIGATWTSPTAWGESLGLGEYMWISMVAADLELEEGNNMQLFDGSRLRVMEETTVAGIKGFLLRKFFRETDESGNRNDVVTSEWVIAPDIGWPLSFTMYEDGEKVFQKVLFEYEKN